MKKTCIAILLLSISQLFAQNCTISGSMTEPLFQGKKIYCLNAQTGKIIDSTIISNYGFQFKTNISDPFIAYIQTEKLSSRNYYYVNVIAEPGNIYCDLVSDSLSGTALNDKYYGFLIERSEKEKAIQELYTLKKHQEAEQAIKELSNFAEQIYLDNKKNAIGALILDYLLSLNTKTYEQITVLMEGAAPIITTYLPLQTKMNQLEKISNTSAGKHYVDLNLQDFKSGKNVKLSKYIDGKVALIDYWASWCRLCRAEIPNIAEIHKKYENNDFIVISLNVWDKPEGQKKAITELNMTWTQLTDTTNNATDTYGIDGIPQIMLIDKNGTIIARDLRGEEIETAVKKALGKQ